MPFTGVRKYLTVGTKGFVQNLQYSASHLINTVASAVFGVVYVYLWRSVTPQGFQDYSGTAIVHYITLNQVTMWFSLFGIRTHVRIRDGVRSGNIATELARPMDYFSYRILADYGSQVYSFVFRGIPVGLLLSRVGFYFPKHTFTWAWALVSIGLAAYIGVVLSYLVGVTAFWTTEIRTANWVVTTLSYGLGGSSMPLEVLPATVQTLARWTPFPCISYYPARIFLELSGPELIWPAIIWSVALTWAARRVTSHAQAKLEVQGG